jgi:hypothetical protein
MGVAAWFYGRYGTSLAKKVCQTGNMGVPAWQDDGISLAAWTNHSSFMDVPLPVYRMGVPA